MFIPTSVPLIIFHFPSGTPSDVSTYPDFTMAARSAKCCLDLSQDASLTLASVLNSLCSELEHCGLQHH